MAEVSSTDQIGGGEPLRVRNLVDMNFVNPARALAGALGSVYKVCGVA